MTAVIGSEIKNLARSGGVIPIDVGQAKLEETEYVLTHYYELTTIYAEVDNLNSNYSSVLNYSSRFQKVRDKLKVFCSFYNHTRSLVQQKIANIRFHGTNRVRRGLINGLGTVIKAITGNLDNDDKERFEKIINELDKKDQNSQSKINQQYSVVNQLIANYNRTLHAIQFNNDQIKLKISEINAVVNSYDGQLIIFKDLLHHLQTSMNLILNVLSDIETSITFCKQGILHPSIVSTHVLQSELYKLSLNLTDVLTYESLIKVRCNVRSERIVYFLTLPIYKTTDYHLYYLYPVPWLINNSYTTIIPKHKYLLKQTNSNEVLPLIDRCAFNEMFYCNAALLSYATSGCESNILSNGSTFGCKFTKLHITDNYLSIVPETNQLIAVFPQEDRIIIKSTNQAETMSLQGIHLINPKADSVYYHDKLMSAQLTSIGSPTFLSIPPLNLESLNLTRMSLHFDDINLKTLDNFHLNLNPVQLDEDNFDWQPLISPSIWTVMLYLLGFSILGYTIFNYRRRRSIINISHPSVS